MYQFNAVRFLFCLVCALWCTASAMALPKGELVAWKGASVFTPNIHVAEGRYWLFCTRTSNVTMQGVGKNAKK